MALFAANCNAAVCVDQLLQTPILQRGLCMKKSETIVKIYIEKCGRIRGGFEKNSAKQRHVLFRTKTLLNKLENFGRDCYMMI